MGVTSFSFFVHKKLPQEAVTFTRAEVANSFSAAHSTVHKQRGNNSRKGGEIQSGNTAGGERTQFLFETCYFPLADGRLHKLLFILEDWGRHTYLHIMLAPSLQCSSVKTLERVPGVLCRDLHVRKLAIRNRKSGLRKRRQKEAEFRSHPAAVQTHRNTIWIPSCSYLHAQPYRERVGKRMHSLFNKSVEGWKIGSTDLKAPVVGLLTNTKKKKRKTKQKKYH